MAWRPSAVVSGVVMTFDDYQRQALKTAISRGDMTLDRTICVLGLAGEAGEAADK